MSTERADSMFNAETAILEYAEILRSSSALMAEEVKYIPPEKRLEFERQLALHMNEIALCLRDFVLNLGQDVGVYSKRNWEESKKQWRPLRKKSERAARQLELVKASAPIEAQTTLRWMAEQGQSDDLKILQKVKELQPYVDEDITALFHLAEQKIADRSEQVIVQSIAELNRSGLRRRDTAKPRGGLSRAATGQTSPSSTRNDAVRLLLEALRDPRPAVRREAAGALGEWGGEDAVMPLTQLLLEPKQDGNDSVRRSCVGALGQIGGPMAVTALVTAAEQDRVEAVRRDAIYALIELVVSDDADVDVLIKQEIIQAMERVSRSPQEGGFLRSKAQSFIELLT